MWALAATTVAVYACQAGTGAAGGEIADRFATVPYNVTHGIVLAAPGPPSPLLTLVTALFVHASAAHIGFNLLFLAAFGPAVEALCGPLRFTAFYLICGVAGQVAQVAFAPGSHAPSFGASGAVAGVLGAYLVSYPASLARALVIVVWAVAQFASGYGELTAHTAGAGEGIAYFVHIGGFGCGVLTIGLFRRRAAGMHAAPR